MRFTFGDAKKLLSQYSGRGGKCPTADDTSLFVKTVLQHLLFKGEYGNIRKFCFTAERGCFTAPPELELPLKVKIDGCVETSHTKWFEYFDSNDLDKCFPADKSLREEANLVPTAFEMVPGGLRVGAVAMCSEGVDASIIVQGKCQGKDVYSFHKGEQISGEYLTLERGVMKYTQSPFDSITGIVKTKTNGYVQLYAVDVNSKKKFLLSDYSPLEEKPAYRRFRITTACQPFAKVSVLARIRLKESYADEDWIPFENLFAMTLAAQRINAENNNDVATAGAKARTLGEILEDESSYKTIQGTPIEVYSPISAGNIKNII